MFKPLDQPPKLDFEFPYSVNRRKLKDISIGNGDIVLMANTYNWPTLAILKDFANDKSNYIYTHYAGIITKKNNMPFPYVNVRNDSLIQGYAEEVFAGVSEVSRALHENFDGMFKLLVPWATNYNKKKFLKDINEI